MDSRGAMNVCILGAGVVGLTTALELQNQFPNANFTTIAHLFNQQTTSDGAAGLFYPSSTFYGPSLDITKKWIGDAYSYYDSLRISSDGENAGVFQYSGFRLSSSVPSLVRSEYMEDVAPVHRYATEEELQQFPGKWKYGSYCVTLGIECRRLLPWALARFQEHGGKVITKKIERFGELADDYDVIMNCSGLSAEHLCQDRLMVPIRGQVIKVHAPWVTQFVFSEHDTYIIPSGRGRVTLGGCRQFSNYNLSVSKWDSEKIREECFQLMPKLAIAPELETWVGLRPHRHPVRVEAEVLSIPNKRGGTLKVVHNYGHGGYGVTTAPGTAKHAVNVFRHLHARSGGNQLSKL
ncbi:D-aspartate oxidase [Ischnura elegans]|uniref:D-aspartate oxidase n=1 Tax=Ischnura elegans TaxID=197161 RepID=UPI001ED89172|nr:D-aspartate oxidase [Ischnura elegans]XP_046396351.1 D-aspartate oxidase [Ischnura elegans]